MPAQSATSGDGADGGTAGTPEWRVIHARAGALFRVAATMIAHGDSYVYLSAVNVMAALANAHARSVWPLLVDLFCDEASPTALRIKVGEALRMAVGKCGDLLPAYARRLVPALLRGTAACVVCHVLLVLYRLMYDSVCLPMQPA